MGVSYRAAASIASSLADEAHDLQEVIELREACMDSEIPQLEAFYAETIHNLQTAINRIRELMRDAFPDPTEGE